MILAQLRLLCQTDSDITKAERVGLPGSGSDAHNSIAASPAINQRTTMHSGIVECRAPRNPKKAQPLCFLGVCVQKSHEHGHETPMFSGKGHAQNTRGARDRPPLWVKNGLPSVTSSDGVAGT
jgi:hypothetical protein